MKFTQDDTTHSINVFIIDDTFAEPDELFTLHLEDPQTRSFVCVARVSPEFVQVVIHDNDC